jgi:hypothetical protein
MRIIVPDGNKIMRTYFDNPDELALHRGRGFACAMDRVNSFFRQGYEHQFIYDEEMLRIHLQSAGFVDPRRVAFRSGRATNLLIDSEQYVWESLYVEADKPDPSILVSAGAVAGTREHVPLPPGY